MKKTIASQLCFITENKDIIILIFTIKSIVLKYKYLSREKVRSSGRKKLEKAGK
ncbi:MAG: hypothetical protein AB2L20_25965 [Mangrovibacterium sp.]